MSGLMEVKITRETGKYNELRTRINETKPNKIVWGYPDIVEMTDKDGKIHTYSIIELLDGLQRLAQAAQKDK